MALSSRRFSGSIGALAPRVLLCLCLAFAGTARADPELALLPFEGPDRAAVGRVVASALADAQVSFWTGPQVKLRLDGAGVSLDAPDVVAKAAQLFHVPMVLRERRSYGQVLLLLLAANGEELSRLLYPTQRGFAPFRGAVDAWLPDALAAGRRAAQTPAQEGWSSWGEPPPRPASAPPREAAPAAVAEDEQTAERPPGEAPWPAIVDFAFGGGTLSHWLDYNDDLFNSLGNYTLAAGALVAGGLAFYPGALATRGPFADIGLLGEFNHTTGLASTFENQSFPTLDDRWTAGLRIRLPLEASELGLSGRYGQQEFRLGFMPGTTAPPIPNYTYAFVQAGLDARWDLGAVAILAEADYVDVVNDGIAVSGFFPHAQVGALAAGLHLGIGLWEGLELRLGADYQRYFFSFNPVPGDAHVAGGAVDQYLVSTLALGLRLR